MQYFSLRPPAVVFLVVLCAFLAGPPCSADVPIFSDSFRPTSPDHNPGSPVDGAKLERGHGRWQSTPGLFFDDGKVKGGGPAEYARFSFAPLNHQASARVFLEAHLDPGANGWSGVGFTNGEEGPLPSVGQLWMKIDDRGRIEVRADGASNKLFKDSHQNPAFIEGMNEVRLEYNRRTNTARAWLNGVELPLSNLDKNGFLPDIQAVAFQLRDDGAGLKVVGGEPGSGGILVGMNDAFLGDEFTVGPGRGIQDGDPLAGVPVQYGTETWAASSSVGFLQGYASNIAIGKAVAGLPYDPDDHPGYAVSSVEALVNPADSDWIGIGFSSDGSTAFTAPGAGQVWARVFSSGRLQILADGALPESFRRGGDQSRLLRGRPPVQGLIQPHRGINPGRPGEVELGIDPVTVFVDTTSFTPMIAYAGFQAKELAGSPQQTNSRWTTSRSCSARRFRCWR